LATKFGCAAVGQVLKVEDVVLPKGCFPGVVNQDQRDSDVLTKFGDVEQQRSHLEEVGGIHTAAGDEAQVSRINDKYFCSAVAEPRAQRAQVIHVCELRKAETPHDICGCKAQSFRISNASSGFLQSGLPAFAADDDHPRWHLYLEMSKK